MSRVVNSSATCSSQRATNSSLVMGKSIGQRVKCKGGWWNLVEVVRRGLSTSGGVELEAVVAGRVQPLANAGSVVGGWTLSREDEMCIRDRCERDADGVNGFRIEGEFARNSADAVSSK